MEEKFKVFPDEYNGVLDLVEIADPKVAKWFKNLISAVPKRVRMDIKEHGDTTYEGNDLTIGSECDDGCLELKMFKKSEPLTALIEIFPFTEEELTEEPHLTDNDECDNVLFLFSLTLSNTVGTPETRIQFVQKNGKYKLDHICTTGDEYKFEIFVQRTGNDCELVRTSSYNGTEYAREITPIGYDELVSYAVEPSENDLDCDALDDIYNDDEFDDDLNANYEDF